MVLRIILQAFFGLYAIIALGQGGEDVRLYEPLKATTPNVKDFYYELPFEYPGAIIMKADIGGETYNFGLDTGGYTMITDAIQQKCNFIIIKNEPLGSTNGITKNTDVVRVDSLSVGRLTFKDVQAYKVNFDNSPTAQCLMDGGLIGSAIIKNYVWQIDYSTKKVTVTDNISKIKGIDKATKVRVHLNNHGQPYFMMQVNGHYQWFMFDTGCSSLLYMDPKDAAKYTAEATAHAQLLDGMVETHHGRINDTINAFKANIDLEGILLKNKPVFYRQGSGLTLLGSPIIKNYIVTLNFSEGEMYFQPIEQSPPVDGWERFGFNLEYMDNEYKVTGLVAGSLAAKTGLKSGDVVLAINNNKITCADYCDCRETFRSLLEKGQALTLTVKQKGQPKKITIKKEKIF